MKHQDKAIFAACVLKVAPDKLSQEVSRFSMQMIWTHSRFDI